MSTSDKAPTTIIDQSEIEQAVAEELTLEELRQLLDGDGAERPPVDVMRFDAEGKYRPAPAHPQS